MEEYPILERYTLRGVHKFNGGNLTLPDEISDKERRALNAIRQYGNKRRMPWFLKIELFDPLGEKNVKIENLKQKYIEAVGAKEKALVIMEIKDEEYKYFNRKRKKHKMKIDFRKFVEEYNSLLYPPTGNFGDEIFNQVIDLHWEKFE